MSNHVQPDEELELRRAFLRTLEDKHAFRFTGYGEIMPTEAVNYGELFTDVMALFKAYADQRYKEGERAGRVAENRHASDVQHMNRRADRIAYFTNRNAELQSTKGEK